MACLFLCSGCAGGPPPSCTNLTERQAIEMSRRLVREEVTVENLIFTVQTTEEAYVVTTEQRELNPGFVPTVVIRRDDCTASVEWR